MGSEGLDVGVDGWTGFEVTGEVGAGVQDKITIIENTSNAVKHNPRFFIVSSLITLPAP